MTTATKPAVHWQAARPDGIAHAWLNLSNPVLAPLCGAEIRSVAERQAWPVRAKCVVCLGHEKYDRPRVGHV